MSGSTLSGRLSALANLGDNWNGYGEKAPTPEALEAAGSIHFCPLPDGGIQVELHRGGVSVEFVIGPDGSLEGECPCADCDLPQDHDESMSGHGSREVTPEDRAIAVRRMLIDSTSPLQITDGMRRALNPPSRAVTPRARVVVRVAEALASAANANRARWRRRISPMAMVPAAQAVVAVLEMEGVIEVPP